MKDMSELIGQLTGIAKDSRFIVDIRKKCEYERAIFEPQHIDILAHGFTNIEICLGSWEYIACLIHQCSHTLHTLSVCIQSSLEYRRLFVGYRGVHILYPNMEKLVIWSRFSGPTGLEKFPQQVVPLPSLVALCLNNYLPIGDDVFFRGNNKTIQYLAIAMHYDVADALLSYRVFYQGSHRNLRYAHIYGFKTYKPMQWPEESIDNYKQLLAGIASNAKTLKTDCEY